jgi:sulfur-carrier protein
VIRVVLPAHLKSLAHVSGELRLPGPVDRTRPVTPRMVLDAIEARYPMLLGTIRDRHTGKRRPFVRFYACEEDLSNDSPDTPLPERVVAGEEPFIILGAMAGG